MCYARPLCAIRKRKFVNKYQYILIFLTVIFSCKSDTITDNSSIINEINKLPYSKTVFEVSVDSNENIIDTLSIEMEKINELGKVVFKSIEYPKEFGSALKKSYYRDDENLFFQEFIFNNGEYKTIYETFVNSDTIIDRAQMVSIESTHSDTIFMKYNYTYDKNGNKESLVVNSIMDSINSFHYTKYNDNEKPEIEYQIINNDTINKTRYQYSNGKLNKQIQETMFPITIELYSYNKNEKLISKKLFVEKNDDIIQSTESTYQYSENNELESVTTRNLLNDSISKRKFLTAHNNA